METIERPIYCIQRLPRWIKRREIDYKDQSLHPGSPDIFLLVDYQEQVKDREIRGYFRSVHKINDSSKLEEASLFLRELRAGNECLIFHRVDLIRNGRRITALNPENISVYRREKSLRVYSLNPSGAQREPYHNAPLPFFLFQSKNNLRPCRYRDSQNSRPSENRTGHC